MFGMLLVAIILVVPCIMPLSWFILELGDGVSVELLGLQPTSANAARKVIADSGIIRLISLFLFLLFIVHVYCRHRGGKSVPTAVMFNKVLA